MRVNLIFNELFEAFGFIRQCIQNWMEIRQNIVTILDGIRVLLQLADRIERIEAGLRNINGQLAMFVANPIQVQAIPVQANPVQANPVPADEPPPAYAAIDPEDNFQDALEYQPNNQ